MEKNSKTIIVHEEKRKRKLEKNLEEFKKLICRYKAEDETIGRDAISARDLAKLANEDYEYFRKILNVQKITSSRDYIILIGILLKMDSNIINNLLAFYGMLVWNPQNDDRDSELMDIADSIASEEKLPNNRLSIYDINNKLQQEGFEQLRIKGKKKEKEKVEEKYRESYVYRYSKKELMYCDDSIAIKYRIDNFHCFAEIFLEDKDSGKQYILRADDIGYMVSEEYCQSDSKCSWTVFKTIEETGDFKKYFRLLLKSSKEERREIKNRLNDTRNYGERIGAGIQDGKFSAYLEMYNYDMPESGEYYLMQYVDGMYKLFVFDKSAFMKFYMRNDEYKFYYKDAEIKALESYESENEIYEKISTKNNTMENELKQKRRLKNYKRLKTKMFDFLNQLCTGTVYVRNLSDIYYDEDDRVCSFFDVNKEFECFEDDFNMIHANKKQIEFTGEYGTINITLEDLCRAFELGFNTIDEIYLMKSEFGSIDIRNILGLNYSQNV